MGRALKKVAQFSAAAIAKLESSGLTAEHAERLGIYEVANATTLYKHFEPLPALVLPYFNLEGKPLKAHPTWPEFYRIRYLGGKHDFAAAAGEKEQRYSQPANTGVCAYFPALINWSQLAEDINEPVQITEGELKAAKATAEGFPTIGLGGVYNFRASKQGIFFLPELGLIKWARRRVIIVYDSDYTEKPDICSAINALSVELQDRGALVELAHIPALSDDGKTGLDDFLVERGADGYAGVLGLAEPLAITRELWQMNDQVVYVNDPGHVVDLLTGQRIPPAAFTAHSKWATAAVPERKVRPDGTVSYVKASAAKEWLSWPLRKAVRKEAYVPGQDQFTDDGCLNKWPGWGVVPKKGNVKPWLELVQFLFDGAERDAVEWFLDWCAYPIQFPGTKLFSAVTVHGRMTGTGKSLIGYTLGRIYGKNFTKIENKHLDGETWWAENRQFILGDEITGNDGNFKRAQADALKTLVTQEEISINIKFIPQFYIKDCINYYFTSNHPDAFFLEDADRRYFVHEVLATAPLPEKFYAEYNEWKNSDEGIGALMWWLMQRDLSKFNPKAPAYKTAARERMVMVGKSDLGLWVEELKRDPASKLMFGRQRHARDLFTSAELLAMCQAEVEGIKATKNAMARALASAGFMQAYGGMPILGTDGKQGRYFIIRNPERWMKVKNAKELAKHIATPMQRA